MGLPSAQLGSLPSMNVPSSVPTIGVQKSPKIWQQALLNILTQTAGAAATQGIGNVMSQDYADDPATGWEKLTKGPRMDKSQKMQKTSLDAASKEAELGRGLTRTENEANRILSKSEAIASRNQAKELSDKQMALQNLLSARSDMNALERQIQNGQQQRDALAFTDTLAGARDRERYNLDVMNPQNIARTKLTETETAKAEQAIAQQKAMQALLSGAGQKPGAGGEQAGAPRPPVQRTIGDGTGPMPQASDALASLYKALTADSAPGAAAPVPPVDAGVPSPYVAMRLGIQPQRENNMVAPAPDQAEVQVLKGAPYSVRAQEIRRKYGIPE